MKEFDKEKGTLGFNMIETAKSLRYHIGIFGKTNSGKSTLLNLLVGQEVSLVSSLEGTTTDPVYKNMEIEGVGASTFIDTAGVLDQTLLGELRRERTKKVLDEVDCAIYIGTDQDDEGILEELKKRKVPIIYLEEGFLGSEGLQEKADHLESKRREILSQIERVYSEGKKPPLLFDGLLDETDELFLLIMPQDASAPTGRLIQPQVQSIRELLDRKKKVMCIQEDEIEDTLNLLKKEPDWIIVDSQVFEKVYNKKPEKSKITSFSILFARAKGDIDILLEGAYSIKNLTEKSRVLISEACTHAPIEEDIGTVKIPRLLKNRFGEGLKIDFSRGLDFPKNLEQYDLVIMCGSCMFNRTQVMRRIEKAQRERVYVTNYGLTIAYLKGILGKVKIHL